MEKIIKEIGEESLGQVFFRDIATNLGELPFHSYLNYRVLQ